MRLIFAAALAAALACAAPAGAQTSVVAQSGSATLSADVRPPDESGRTLELTLRQPAAPDDDEVERLDTPIWPDEVALINADVAGAGDEPRRRILVGGAVAAGVAAVELQFPSGRTRVATVAGAGAIRFFLTEISLPPRGGDDTQLVRLLDAHGRVIGVSVGDESMPAIRSARLAPGLRAVVRPRLVPTPLQPERYENEASASTRAVAESRPTRRCCELNGQTCGRSDTMIAGFVPDGTRALVVLLGSGRRLRLRARAVPGSLGIPATYVAGRLPLAEAVRGVQAVGAGGRVLARDDRVAAPPGVERCPGAAQAGYYTIVARDFACARLGTPPGTEIAVAPANGMGPRLVVREVGDRLCVGFDRLDADGRDCEPPPINSRIAVAASVSGPAQRSVGAVLAGPVAFVDLHLREGGRLRLPTVEGDGYTGRFRGHVRFLLAPLSADQTPLRGDLLDATGRVIGALEIEHDGERRLASGARELLRAGPARLSAGSVIEPGEATGYPCIILTIGRGRPDPDECHGWRGNESTVTATVSCSPRAVVLHGTVERAIHRVELRLASGRRLTIPTRALPRSLRPRVRYFLAVVPRGAVATEVRFPNEGAVGTPLAPLARQCGYGFAATVF